MFTIVSFGIVCFIFGMLFIGVVFGEKNLAVPLMSLTVAIFFIGDTLRMMIESCGG